MNDDRVIKTYVWHGGKCFFVSTINRDSSALGSDGRYAETLVWEFDWEKNERLGWMDHGTSAAENSIRGHIRTVENLHKYGAVQPPEDD